MNQKSSSQEFIAWESRESIALPSNGEGSLAIRRIDWNRLKRLLKRVMVPASKLSTVYGILFGIGTSSGLSIIPAASQALPAWVLPFYVVISAGSFIGGLVFVRLEKEVCDDRKSAVADIMEDMKEIENTFKKPSGEDEK